MNKIKLFYKGLKTDEKIAFAFGIVGAIYFFYDIYRMFNNLKGVID